MVGLLPPPAAFYCCGRSKEAGLMGSLIDELQRREAAAGAEAEELRRRIAELAEQLAQAEERLSRLVIARGAVEEGLDGAATEIAPVSPAAGRPDGTALAGAGGAPVGRGGAGAAWG